MMREIYLVLKGQLKTQNPFLEQVNWDYEEYLNRNGSAISSPSLYIRFNPIRWSDVMKDVQRAVLDFDLTLVSQTSYADDNDITELSYINHLANEGSIYKSLAKCRFKLSDVPGLESLAGTINDKQLMETIVRTGQGHSERKNNLIITKSTYQSTVFDYSATPIGVLVEDLMLDLDIKIVDDLYDEA